MAILLKMKSPFTVRVLCKPYAIQKDRELLESKPRHSEALRIYIDMNFEGLKDDVLSMIAGNIVPGSILGIFLNDKSDLSFSKMTS